MTGSPWEVAAALRRKHVVTGRASDEDLEAIVAAEGAEIVVDPGLTKLRRDGLYVDGTIHVRPGLAREDWRRVVAHELWHHLRDRENQLRLHPLHRAKKENQAEQFAGAFLIGDEEGEAWQIAEACGLPQWWVERWIGLWCGQAAVSAGWRTAG